MVQLKHFYLLVLLASAILEFAQGFKLRAGNLENS